MRKIINPCTLGARKPRRSAAAAAAADRGSPHSGVGSSGQRSYKFAITERKGQKKHLQDWLQDRLNFSGREMSRFTEWGANDPRSWRRTLRTDTRLKCLKSKEEEPLRTSESVLELHWTSGPARRDAQTPRGPPISAMNSFKKPLRSRLLWWMRSVYRRSPSPRREEAPPGRCSRRTGAARWMEVYGGNCPTPPSPPRAPRPWSPKTTYSATTRAKAKGSSRWSIWWTLERWVDSDGSGFRVFVSI